MRLRLGRGTVDARFTPLHGKPVTCGPRKGAPCPAHVGLLCTPILLTSQ